MMHLEEIIEDMEAAGLFDAAKKLRALRGVITLEVISAWRKEIGS